MGGRIGLQISIGFGRGHSLLCDRAGDCLLHEAAAETAVLHSYGDFIAAGIGDACHIVGGLAGAVYGFGVCLAVLRPGDTHLGSGRDTGNGHGILLALIIYKAVFGCDSQVIFGESPYHIVSGNGAAFPIGARFKLISRVGLELR